MPAALPCPRAACPCHTLVCAPRRAIPSHPLFCPQPCPRAPPPSLRNVGVFWMRLAMYVMLCLGVAFVYFQLGNSWKVSEQGAAALGAWAASADESGRRVHAQRTLGACRLVHPAHPVTPSCEASSCSRTPYSTPPRHALPPRPPPPARPLLCRRMCSAAPPCCSSWLPSSPSCPLQPSPHS